MITPAAAEFGAVAPLALMGTRLATGRRGVSIGFVGVARNLSLCNVEVSAVWGGPPIVKNDEIRPAQLSASARANWMRLDTPNR